MKNIYVEAVTAGGFEGNIGEMTEDNGISSFKPFVEATNSEGILEINVRDLPEEVVTIRIRRSNW